MSLYHEAASFFSTPHTPGSLCSRIFNRVDLKSQPAQVYALAIETCKWSAVLKEVIENTDFLRLEHKVTPLLSTFLVHDLLLAKRGISLPATHGLRTAVERHKGRLQAEFTKARIRRKAVSLEAFRELVEKGLEDSVVTNQGRVKEAPYPRWIRVNSLKTTLEEQLDTTFTGFQRVKTVSGVRQKKGAKRIFIDTQIPNLVAVTPDAGLSKSEAYKCGLILFQDKASCFPAYLLDPLPVDGDVIDTCAAPGNKSSHLAAIIAGRSDEGGNATFIHAFEKNKRRADTLAKMLKLAGADGFVVPHPEQDFLKSNPNSQLFANVGALLLDPSCSGSGIVGRDEMLGFHVPELKKSVGGDKFSKNRKRVSRVSLKAENARKRKGEDPAEIEVLVDDDGEITAVSSEGEFKTRLDALSQFQLELLLHAFRYPAARKITYSTCSLYAQENEGVVTQALQHPIAKERGWRVLRREEQVRGMREWPVRGHVSACDGDSLLAEACIRANKGDEHGTMGFFVAGFVRDGFARGEIGTQFLRDQRGHLAKNVLGISIRVGEAQAGNTKDDEEAGGELGIEDAANPDIIGPRSGDQSAKSSAKNAMQNASKPNLVTAPPAKNTHNEPKTTHNKKRPNLGIKQDRKRRKTRR